MRHPCIPKGRAMAMHLTEEYKEGQAAPADATNPYNYWNEYEKRYAWDIGHQERN